MMMSNGILQSSVIFARCSIVGHVIQECRIAPMGALMPGSLDASCSPGFEPYRSGAGLYKTQKEAQVELELTLTKVCQFSKDGGVHGTRSESTSPQQSVSVQLQAHFYDIQQVITGT